MQFSRTLFSFNVVLFSDLDGFLCNDYKRSRVDMYRNIFVLFWTVLDDWVCRQCGSTLESHRFRGSSKNSLLQT